MHGTTERLSFNLPWEQCSWNNCQETIYLETILVAENCLQANCAEFEIPNEIDLSTNKKCAFTHKNSLDFKFLIFLVGSL